MSQDLYGSGSGASSGFAGSGAERGGDSFGGQDDGMASRAYESARGLTDQARERAMQFAEDGKEQLSEQIDDVAQAIRKAAETMRDGEQAMPAKYVSQAADRLEDLSRTIRETDVDEMLSSLQRFARRNRTAIFGGAVLAGLALGRFAVASGRNRTGGSQNRSGSRTSARTSSGYPAQDQDYGSADQRDLPGVVRSGTGSSSVGTGST